MSMCQRTAPRRASTCQRSAPRRGSPDEAPWRSPRRPGPSSPVRQLLQCPLKTSSSPPGSLDTKGPRCDRQARPEPPRCPCAFVVVDELGESDYGFLQRASDHLRPNSWLLAVLLRANAELESPNAPQGKGTQSTEPSRGPSPPTTHVSHDVAPRTPRHLPQGRFSVPGRFSTAPGRGDGLRGPKT